MSSPPLCNNSLICFSPYTNTTLTNNTTSIYYGEFFFDLDNLTGAVESFSVAPILNHITAEIPLTIHQIDMVEPNKLVGGIGNRFTSLLSLDIVDYTILTNTTLTNLIIAINQEAVIILEKIGMLGNDTLDLNILEEIPLPEELDDFKVEYCKIHLYNVTSNISANFLLSCGLTQTTTQGYPYTLISMNYTPGLPPQIQSSMFYLPVLL